MWADYFITVAVLSFFYLLLRHAFISAVKLHSMPRKPVDVKGKGIETSTLSRRIQHVREELAQAKVPIQSAGFKRALMVQNQRAQIATLPFFQTRPLKASKPEDDQPGLHLILA